MGRRAITTSSSSGILDRSRRERNSSCPRMPNSPKAGDPLPSVKNIRLPCCVFTGTARCLYVRKLESILIAKQVQDYASPVRPHAMFEQIHALPGAQCKFSLVDWNRQLRLRERRPDVGRHIVRPFRRVPVEACIFRYQALQEIGQITQYIGMLV